MQTPGVLLWNEHRYALHNLVESLHAMPQCGTPSRTQCAWQIAPRLGTPSACESCRTAGRQGRYSADDTTAAGVAATAELLASA